MNRDYETATDAAAKEAPIHAEMRKLGRDIDTLSDAFERLGQKIEPVRKPMPPPTGACGSVNPDGPCSDIAGKLAAMSRTVRAMEMRVNEISSTVEL